MRDDCCHCGRVCVCDRSIKHKHSIPTQSAALRDAASRAVTLHADDARRRDACCRCVGRGVFPRPPPLLQSSIPAQVRRLASYIDEAATLAARQRALATELELWRPFPTPIGACLWGVFS
jgi:hypothetical protein